jgi:hypothetical protein
LDSSTPATEDNITLCEVACRTGGGEIGPEMLELFAFNLDKTVIQSLSDNTITNEKLEKNPDLSWEQVLPESDACVGWLFIYPKAKHEIEFIPKHCEDPNVVLYRVFGQIGDKFLNVKSCSDSIVSFLVREKSEQTVYEKMMEMVQWFEKTSKWKLL